MDLLEAAKAIAEEAHKDQKRWGGEPYMTHVQAVVDGVETYEERVVAYLHDVVEDSNVTIQGLLELGFPTEILRPVMMLTHQEGDSYEEYIRFVGSERISTIVKLSDLTHNLSDLQLGSRRTKYQLAKMYLNLKKAQHES